MGEERLRWRFRCGSRTRFSIIADGDFGDKTVEHPILGTLCLLRVRIIHYHAPPSSDLGLTRKHIGHKKWRA